MHTSAVLAVGLSLLGAASARIHGIAVPKTIEPGSNFTIQLLTEGYIQSIIDVAASFGYSDRSVAYPGQLGPNYLGNRTFTFGIVAVSC